MGWVVMSWSVYIFLFEANMDVKLNNDFNFIKVDYYFARYVEWNINIYFIVKF